MSREKIIVALLVEVRLGFQPPAPVRLVRDKSLQSSKASSFFLVPGEATSVSAGTTAAPTSRTAGTSAAKDLSAPATFSDRTASKEESTGSPASRLPRTV